MTNVDTLLNDPDTAGVWSLDPDRSTVNFKIKNFWGLINVKGRFTDVNADAQKLQVMVNIFERQVPVEVGFENVKKLD